MFSVHSGGGAYASVQTGGLKRKIRRSLPAFSFSTYMDMCVYIRVSMYAMCMCRPVTNVRTSVCISEGLRVPRRVCPHAGRLSTTPVPASYLLTCSEVYRPLMLIRILTYLYMYIYFT